MARMSAISVGQIGGLAVALGIGAAVATGLAASASAAPEETASDAPVRTATGPAREGAARTAAVHRVATAGPESNPPAAHMPAGVTATAAVRGPRVAAAVRAPLRRAAAVPAPTAADPGPAPAAANTVVTPGAPAPAAARSAGARSVLQFLRPDPRGRLITIYKGTHFAIPNSFGIFIKEVSGTGTFTANSAYDLNDADQYDWSKFTGIAFTPLQPDRNSVMVGWRYNLNTQQFEIAPFYNVDRKRILPNENPNSPNYEVISVPVDQPFTFTVNYSGVTLSYGDRTVYKPFPPGLTANVWTAVRVSGWFGGNKAAPRTVSYFLNLN